MTFVARQVLTAAQLNDLDINTLTTSGDVTVGGTLTTTGTVTVGGFTLPATDGSADQVLVTNGSGTVTWQDAAGGSPGGSDGYIQYNDGGSFGGASGLTYNDTTTQLGTTHINISRSGTALSTPALDIENSGGAGDYNYVLRADNDTGAKVVFFVNGSTRTADGGANVMTLRNDGGGSRFGNSSYATTIAGSSITLENSITVGAEIYMGNWVRLNGEKGLYSESYGQHFYPDSGGFYWDIDGPLRVRSGYEGGIQGYLGYHDVNGFGLLHSGGSWWLNTNNNDAHLVIGGSVAYNAYNSVTGRRLMFGGGDADAQGNYYIGTNLENYNGNYNKLDLRWHTGIRMGAQAQYGGIRMYNNEDLSSVIFSVGQGDTHVRVTNNLYVGGRIYPAEWIESTGHQGLYNPTNAAHWYPSNESYGSWKSDGSRGGYNGISFSRTGGYATLMVRASDGLIGLYNSGRWQIYGEYGGATRLYYAGSQKLNTESDGVYVAGITTSDRGSSASSWPNMQFEAVSGGSVAGYTAHLPGIQAAVFRTWSGLGEGWDSGNSQGTGYRYLGASSFVTRSSARWKKNIHSRSDDEIIPTAMALLSCRTAVWDETSLESEWCEHDHSFKQVEITDGCECGHCAGVKADPIQSRHFNRRGYIVEELNEVFPQAVQYEADGSPSGIDYAVVTTELVDIVKLLVLQCDEQERRLALLEV